MFLPRQLGLRHSGQKPATASQTRPESPTTLRVALGSLAFAGRATCPGSPSSGRKRPSEPWPRGWAAKWDHLGPGPGLDSRLVSSFQASASQLGAAPPGLPPAEKGWGVGRRDRSPAGRAQGPDRHPPPMHTGPEGLQGRPQDPATSTGDRESPPCPPQREGRPAAAQGVQVLAGLENPRSWG